jgi:TPR repeat protein
MREAAHYFKWAVDQGHANSQHNYRPCLQRGESIPIDYEGAAHYCKFVAGRRFTAAQFDYEPCLRHGESISTDLTRVAHFFRLAAVQGLGPC